jgi:pyruvate dehydrogenase E2 component (dihydrolipoamide acetyltransferase)
MERKFLLPDIGDFEDVDVVEVLVKPGESVGAEQSLIVLESDKATMEIPSPFAGVVKALHVKVGDKVSEGSAIATLDVEGADESAAEPQAKAARVPEGEAVREPAQASKTREAARPSATTPRPSAPAAPAPAATPARPAPGTAAEPPDPRLSAADAPAPLAHASPSVRRLARELGVDLTLVPARGPKGRVLEDDVRGYVKAMLAKGTAAGVPIAGVAVVRPPEIDFERFGPTETVALNRVRKVAAGNLHRSWVTVPHVTQFDVADVTDLEAFRTAQKPAAEARGVKLTFLPFVVKAVAAALHEFPHFNSSLDRTGENLILKRYVHIGVAVDTEHGLVVPVLRDADRKGLFAIAAELETLSARARDRKLRPEDLAGASFSISSLGGIGGSHFTPIVNHPEVAILGVSRMEWRPVYQDGEFVPRRSLPLSLSYDHRVIDGADAVRFTTRLAQLLADLRLLLL